jgi:hypothetical protein
MKQHDGIGPLLHVAGDERRQVSRQVPRLALMPVGTNMDDRYDLSSDAFEGESKTLAHADA